MTEKQKAVKRLRSKGNNFVSFKSPYPTVNNTHMNALFSPPQSTATSGLAVQPTARRSSRLSARQLLDVELGLFLLSQLLPAAPPDALPGLLSETDPVLSTHLSWTARQRRLRNRGRALLTHLSHYNCWQNLLETYMAAPVHLQAYDISLDRTGFHVKTVGFSRNRLSVLRKILG